MAKKKDNLTYRIPDLFTPKGNERRTAIVKAVIGFIAEGTVTDISFERVAKACGIRRSLVAYYFSSQEVLLRSAIEYAMGFGQDFALQHIALAATAEERLKAFVDANFEWFRKFPEHAAVFGFLNYLAITDSSYRELHGALADMAEKRLVAILKGGPLKTKVESSIEATAFALRAHLVGSLARFFTLPKRPHWERERIHVHAGFFKLTETVWHRR